MKTTLDHVDDTTFSLMTLDGKNTKLSQPMLRFAVLGLRLWNWKFISAEIKSIVKH